jgi:hypothetical protein
MVVVVVQKEVPAVVVVEAKGRAVAVVVADQ